MKERQILFTGPMVRANLEGRKTQTRRTSGLSRLNDSWYRDRIEKVECRDGLWHFWDRGHGSSALPVFTARCPYGQPGDRLWVKETHGFWCHSFESVGVQYAAGGEDEIVDFPDKKGMPTLDVQTRRNRDGSRRMRPSIFMPRWASRITLEIVSVRVERLNEITKADAVAEGIERIRVNGHDYWKNYRFKTAHPQRGVTVTDKEHRLLGYESPCASFQSLWESINGPGSWDANPWVWVVEVKP